MKSNRQVQVILKTDRILRFRNEDENGVHTVYFIAHLGQIKLSLTDPHINRSHKMGLKTHDLRYV